MRRLVNAAAATILVAFSLIAMLGAAAFQHPRSPITASILDYGGAMPKAINVLVLAAVALTYPLQFYAGVVLFERRIDLGPGATQARRADAAKRDDERLRLVQPRFASDLVAPRETRSLFVCGPRVAFR